MTTIPEHIFKKYLLTERDIFLSESLIVEQSLDTSQQATTMDSNQSSQSSQLNPLLTDSAIENAESPEFETLQSCQQSAVHHYQNEDSQQSFENWACEDFDLLDFIGVDDQDQNFSGSASQNGGDLYAQGNQFDSNGKEGKEDQMYSIMQYNDLALPHEANQQLYGNQEMTNGFLQDDQYQATTGSSLLNNTINKLHLQQQNQPSTSRLSNVVINQSSQQSYSNRMRPQMPNSLGQQMQINATDLSENILPTSSTSPQNNASLYMAQQPIVKCEPNYEMNANNEYFDSTSDNESHYSGHNRNLNTSSSAPRKYRIKPESERLNPQYRLKRAKNNDAVRRSREKAKQQQNEKERRLQFLETQHNEHFKEVNAYKQRIRELEAEILSLRKNCNCATAEQLFRH